MFQARKRKEAGRERQSGREGGRPEGVSLQEVEQERGSRFLHMRT